MMDIFRVELGETADDGDQQTTTLFGVGGEELTKVHRVQQFGISSVAPKGSHGIGMSLHGRRDLVAAIGIENAQYRPRNTQQGGTIIYDMYGSAVSLVEANLRTVHAKKIENVCGSAIIRMLADGTVEINP